MGSGGARHNSGRKKISDSAKLHVKTFCLHRDIIDWLESDYGKGCHALVRGLLREQYEKDQLQKG